MRGDVLPGGGGGRKENPLAHSSRKGAFTVATSLPPACHQKYKYFGGKNK
jgi:hypothetical protein